MSFSSDYEKNKNKNKTSNLLKVPQVVPQKTQQDNSRRATAARNREQQRVQAHGGQTQTTQRVNTQQRTTVRQNTSSGSSQRSTPIIQKTQSTQQTSFGLGTLNQMTNSGLASLGRTFAKNAQQQSSTVQDNSRRARIGRANESKRKAAYAQARQTQADKTQLLKNSMDWYQTSDPNRRAQLRQQNDALRQKLGYYYDPASGSTYDKDGNEFTIGVRKAYNSTPTERLSQVDNTLYTSGVMGKKDKLTAYPTAYEAAQGVTVDDLAGQTGYNAHKALYDLFNRSDETWSKEDTQTRDRARQELSDEMSRILKKYGLTYRPRDNADDIMNRLKAAGADDNTLAYVQENIDLRDAADRLGNSMEAVGKRWIASLPSLVDTSQQVSANVEESRQNEEYRQLEEQEQQLELTLQGMNSTAADGSVPADYQAVYDQLQDVKKRKNELTVNKSVDPNKWSQRMLREANEAQMNAEAGLAAAPRWLTEQGISLAGNAPMMAASAIPVVGPVVGSVVMGAQAAGQRSFELNERGIGARESLTRGMVSGVIEAASEKLPLGQMSKILHSGGTNAVKNILIQMGEEATEESASYFLNYVADKAAQDPDAEFSLQELIQSAAGGAFGGLVYGTAGALGSRAATDTERNNAANAYNYDQNQINELVQIDSELQAALKLPEGPIRESAVQAAQDKMVDKISGLMTQQAAQNAELTANYDADLNNRMSLEQRAQAAEYLNQRTGQADAWQDGQTKPRLGTETEQRAESTYRTQEEEAALQSQLAKYFAEEQQTETGGVYDKETVENYRNQIDGTFDGSLPINRLIELGNTPDVLQQYGADNLPLRMTQQAARKIAYPEGYMGGKHNLGIPALKQLQQQLNDPIAVLKSKTQENSLVVLTEWNDTSGNPVIAAVHLNKQGIVDDVNTLASAYGKRNLTALLGENNENVVYTKENKSINQLLDNRLQLPELVADDTLVANSIRQKTENSNSFDKNIPLNELMQYGKTPEQAAMEIQAKAEGERVRQAMNRPEMREARMIAERLGAKFEVADLGAAGGRYENGTVTINPYADNPVRQVLVHELTHHLENSGVYNDLQTAALRAFSEEQGVSADVLRKNITNLYAQKGVTLDLDGANRELTAAFCENRLFQDENSIQRLAQTDLNLFQRIRQWFSDMVIRLRGTEEQKRILEVQRLYEKAARSVGTVQDRGAQYQIQQDAAGNDFVQVDEDILDGKTEKDHAAILSDIIRNKFGGVIEANGQTFGVNNKTNNEWRRSKNAGALYSTDKQTYYDKIRTFNNADELMQASTDYVGEAPKHPRKDNFREFARGKVNYKVGENGYTADVVVGITRSGKAYLYDIVNIKSNKITEPPLLAAMMDDPSKPLVGDSVDNSIHQNTENGNTSGTKFKGLALQREYRQAVESGNMERAREILAEKAARRGYSSYDTVADAQNHIIQNANPVEDDYHTWIRNTGDVHTFADVLSDSDWNGMDFDPDYTWDMAQRALQTGEITVYSSYPIGTLGGFVTPSRMEAEGYAGNGEVYSKTVNVNDIAWIDPTQGQYAPTQNGNIYKQGSPYAKTLDVTYDNNGKLIPLSQRYDDSRTDSRYTLGLSPEQIAKGTVPLNDLMQYGKTPEQAAMEANARAEGERVRQAREAAEQAQETEAPDSAPESEQVKPLGNYEMYGKSKEQAMRELQNKLTEKRSFLHDDDYKQVRAVQSAELRETWEQARPVKEQIEKFQKNHPLSAKDEQLLQAAMVNGATDTFKQCDDPAAVMHRYQMQQELNRRMQPIKDYQRARSETMALNAEEMADTIAEFAKDKKIPGAYSRETMERNSYDIFGKNNRDKAEQLNDEYFAPVHKAVADRTNYVNTMREQVADLHLGKHESALVQMALEGRNDVAAEYIKNNNIKITSELQKNVADGVATFQAIYKELYESINETLLSNGMEPVRARKNYAPHFVKDKPDTVLSRIRYSFGWGKDSTLNIGTDIAGITDDFKPGKKWFGNLLQREGELTDYDAVAGFDRYIETAGDVIFLTDSVQQLRSLEDALRYRLSDEGTKEKVNQIRNDRNLNALERHQKIDEAYNPNQDNIQKLYNQKKQGMGGYVSNLHEYINNLAGKKARADRGWEEMIGRQMYTVAKNVEGRVAANMIALNPGSWVTNFIPITQASGEVSTANLIRAMRDTVKSAVKDDGFTDGSVFLTNREGTQMLDRTLTRKISDLAGMPMEAIDHFTSNVVTRAKYLQNIQDGMDVQTAFDNADTFAANLIADRSKGAQPTTFNSVNPIRKVFTMFQLEVNNQLSYLFKDLPRAKQSVPKLAWAYTKVFTGAYLFNAVYHQLTGRDSAFDPISMVGDAFDLDPLELIADAFGLGDDDDKEKKKKSGVDIALDLGENIAEQIPFAGGLLGGGRVPISSAFPDFGKLKEEYENGYDGKRIALDAAKSAANSAAYLLLPFGGGAVKKMAEGAATVHAGGSYSLDKNGEKILQFPQYGQSPMDYVQAMLFGKSSLPGAQEWADNGYDSLNADETKVYETLKDRMSWNKDANGNTVDNSEAVYAAIKAMKAITSEQGYGDVSANQIREMLMNNNDLTEMQKSYIDRELISGGETGDYSSRDAFDISQNVREARQDDAFEALEHGISVDDFVKWDSVLEQTLADNYVDAKDFVEGEDNQLYAKNTVLSNILDEYAKDGEHTEAEKNAFADYVLISAMEESDRDKWNDEVKGSVNAADYVKFKGDLAAYNKEFTGTGADNAANVANILNGYTNLTDEQKSVLMNTYNDTAKNDVFHVSEYEKSLADNSYYKSLNDSEKSKLRAYCNEYEQAINEGKELSGWKAKAYMAKEAGIEPGTYALFQTALSLINSDGGTAKTAEITEAVKLVPGLTDSQRAYLWQAAKGDDKTKNNPWGSATVTKYQKGEDEAINPVEGGVIPDGGGFGWRTAPTEGASSNHKAIDIAAAAGTPVKAVMSGTVTAVATGYNGGYGNTVEITHPNGLVTKYHHMLDGSVDGVSVGQEVSAGTQIGQVGSTGISTGPHLDFQVVKDGNYVDPRNYIPGYGEGTSETISAAQATASSSSSSKSSKSSSGGSSKSSGGSSSSGLKTLDQLDKLGF